MGSGRMVTGRKWWSALAEVTIVAGGGLGRAGLVEVISEGVERDVAPAAELGLSQAATAEIVEEGVPA